MNVEQLKTTDQVAVILRTNDRGVLRLISKGELRSAKVLGAWLTPVEEIEAYIRSKMKATDPAIPA